MNTVQPVGTNSHHRAENGDADGHSYPLARGENSGGEPFVGILDTRCGDNGRGDYGSDMTEEADEQHRDQQP